MLSEQIMHIIACLSKAIEVVMCISILSIPCSPRELKLIGHQYLQSIVIVLYCGALKCIEGCDICI